MKNAIINANLVTGGKIHYGQAVIFESGRITAVCPADAAAPILSGAKIYDAKGAYCSSGFIDLHVHGGGGSDFMDASIQDFETIAAYHARHGTTAMLATTLTCPDAELFETLELFNEYKNGKNRKGAKLLGFHLEGPYFSHEQRGAQDPAYLKTPSKEHLNEIFSRSDYILRISAAPETDAENLLPEICARSGVLLSAGHSAADCRETERAYKNGYKLLTHFYSGMSGVVRKNCYRVGGMVEAGYLTDGLSVEIIADGSHLPGELLRLITKIKQPDKIVLITDCISASGSPHETKVLGSKKNGQPVIIKDGVAFMPDMSGFAGSVATADVLVNTMLRETALPLSAVIKMITENPAALIKTKERLGKIKKGYAADLVIFDYTQNQIKVKDVFISGELN